MYLLGIDGGQTSTKSCLYDQATGTCLLANGPPIDHMLTLNGQIKSKQGIQRSLQRLLEQAVLTKPVEMAFVSISGVHKEHEQMIKNWILECIHVDHFLVEGDVKANLAGASAGENNGMLIIAGGGSLGYCDDGEREFVAGGYGHILGDEGSAYWIGLQAIKEGVRYSDGRGTFTMLHDRILDHFRETSYWGVKKQLHSDKIQRSDIAGVATLVEKAAYDGDAVAQSVLLRAGKELGELAVSVLRQMERYSRALPFRKVYATGGVFQSTHWVKRSMVETIRSYDPLVEVCSPRYPPVIGALILAAQLLGKELNLSKIGEALRGADQ
jgi:N-acetylglucosamine kinase-like BadF-type ATPase